MIHLTREELKDILHSATGNIKDFVTNEDMFIDDWIDSNRVKKNVVLDNVSNPFLDSKKTEQAKIDGNNRMNNDIPNVC